MADFSIISGVASRHLCLLSTPGQVAIAEQVI